MSLHSKIQKCYVARCESFCGQIRILGGDKDDVARELRGSGWQFIGKPRNGVGDRLVCGDCFRREGKEPDDELPLLRAATVQPGTDTDDELPS